MGAASDQPNARAARRFGDLVFDDDLLGATRDDGVLVRLTRQERALVRAFLARPGRLLSRDQLLTALSDDPGDISDRNVDFIVNRLRRKLKDPARQPRFIATQYGEGYVWIAEPREAQAAAWLLVIGPVRGAADPVAQAAAEGLIARLQAAMEARTAPGRVVARPGWRGGDGESARFSLEVSVRSDGGRPQAALTLREEPGRVSVRVIRVEAGDGFGEAECSAAASALISAIWGRLTVGEKGAPAPSDAPLRVRMHDAVQLLSPSDETWVSLAPRLAADRAASPEDPRVAIMWATHLAARLMRGLDADPTDPATYEPIEDEIEGLAFASLPAVEDDPDFRLAAANLLLGVHRGHAGLVEEIASQALATSAGYAMALPVLGMAEAERGDLASSIARYDEALRLVELGTEFEIFLLVLKMRSLTAAGDHDAAQRTFDRIKTIKPVAGQQMGLMYLRPGDEHLSPELRLRLARMNETFARRFLGFISLTIARRFSLIEHKRNVLAGPVDHFVRRFGDAILPDSVKSILAEA